MKEYKVILEAQLPKSYHSAKASVEDEQQGEQLRRMRCKLMAAGRHTDKGLTEPAKPKAQPESSKAVAQQGRQPLVPQKDIHNTIPSPKSLTINSAGPSNPTSHKGCASPEYGALFVPWPFKAPSRGQTPMPSFIAHSINSLPTKEERNVAKQLWNPSLPVAANVGIIQYNRVDGEKFKERVSEKIDERWWKGLEDLARELNEAASALKGKGKSGEMIEGKGKEREGKAVDEGSQKGQGTEMKTVELSKEKSKEAETKIPEETGGQAKEPVAKTPTHLAEASELVVNAEGGSNPEAAKSATEESKEPHPNPDSEAELAAIRLLSLSQTPTSAPPNDPLALAASNPLSALWYLITRFFSSGDPAASNFFVALEASIRLNSTTIHPLHIPAPPTFWTSSADWTVPKTGMTLLLTLASSPRNMFPAFTHYSRSMGPPALSATEMRQTKPASLRKAVLCAKASARDKGRTTVLGVDLRDVGYSALCERYGREDIEARFATFGRMFVLGVCAEGAKLWLVGGEWGEVSTVWESNGKVGAGVGTWEEMDEFVKAFEGVAVADGQWNTKRFKWFHRCFAVDLKQFDLQISDEEKKKRGMQEKKEGVKKLLNEIEAWVDIYKIEDVRMEDMGKFTWL